MNRTFKKNFKVTLITVFLIVALIGCQVFQTMASASGGITVTVTTQSQLLSAIDAAQDGDIIGIQSGITISGITQIGDLNKHITLERVDASSYFNISSKTKFQNVTLDGGGISASCAYVLSNENVTFQDVIFQNCINPSANGGAVYLINYTASFNNCTFDGNSAVQGGHIYVANVSTATITNCTMKNGHASSDGGAIRNASSTATCNITSSIITGNSANDFGGGISNNGRMTITTSKIYDNTAPNGGADIANSIYSSFTLADSLETLVALFESDGIVPIGWVNDYDFFTTPIITDVDPYSENSLLKLNYSIATPTPDPTSTPTPTMTPTPEPTVEPTIEPTATPTVEPTAEPTTVPTTEPTVEPSPTEVPVTPTTEPTAEPTTAAPTTEPTQTPTPIPTEVPTYSPSPTEQPSIPTINPTVTPIPTSVPVIPPITIPSSSSSSSATNPAATPTVTPTVKPSATPTAKPTTAPSKSPTPTNKPTVTPKPSPTSKPSAAPTKKPTVTPTVIKSDSQASDALYNSASASNSLGYNSGSAVNEVASEPTEKPVSEEEKTVLEPTISAVTEQGSINSLDKNVKIISNGADCVFEINDEGYTITINSDADKSTVPTVGSNIVNNEKSGSYDWIEIVKVALLLGIFLCLLKNSGLVKIKDKNE